MAKGIVTDSDIEFRKLMDGFPAQVGQLGWQCRSLIRDLMPRVVEVVWHDMKCAGYGTGPKKMSEHFCWVTPYTGHVVLGFYYGSELPDPEGLLEGTGKLMRHVKVRSSEDLDNPHVRTLVEAASQHRVPQLPPPD